MESEIGRSMAELYAPPVRAPRGGPRSHVGCGWCCAVCGGYVRVPGVRGAYVDSTGQTCESAVLSAIRVRLIVIAGFGLGRLQTEFN